MTYTRCSECREPAVEIEPDDIPPCNGPLPSWSHEDGTALCPLVGENGYEPAQVEFL